jgi:hypothetical protein
MLYFVIYQSIKLIFYVDKMDKFYFNLLSFFIIFGILINHLNQYFNQIFPS